MANNKGPFTTRPTTDKLSRIVAAIKAKPVTADDLADRVAMSRRTVNRYIRHLSGTDGEPRIVRISKYEMKNKRLVPIYAMGSAPDAVWPKQCEIKRQALRRARVKADIELSLRQQNYEKAQWAVEKARRTQSTWFSALPGA